MRLADHSCFAAVFDADIAAIPLRTMTSIRHINPQTGKGYHRDEAARVLKFFRTAVLAELGRPGRMWDWAPPSQAVVEVRLADCDHPIRDKVPGTVSDGHVGAGVLSATSFGWVAKQIDHLTGEKGRRGVSIESIGMKMLKALRDSMVEYVGKVIAVKRTATPTSQAAGPADNAIDDDVAEGQKAPQGAVAAQHHGNARVHGEGGNGGGGDAEAGAGRSETEKSSSESESESESEEEDEAVKRKDEEEYEEEEEENKDENGEKWEGGKDEEGGDEEVEFVVEYVEGTVEAGAAEEAVGSADQGNEEEKDDGAGNATRSAGVGKEKGEVGVEAPGNGQDEAACEGGGKVSVDAGEGPNNTGEQEAGEPPSRVPVTPLRLPARLPAKRCSAAWRHIAGTCSSIPWSTPAFLEQHAAPSLRRLPASRPVPHLPRLRWPPPPPADPKSDFLRAHLGARKATAPSVTLPELGKSATPMSVNATAPTPGASVVNVAAEKGVSAALATGGRADKHADLAVVMAHFEAAKRPEHAPVMAIMDTAHVVPSATHGGGSTEQTAATAAVAEINAGRKEKDDNGKGKAVSQRSTRAMTAGKLTSEEKGKKAEGEKDKTGGKGKPAKKKEKAEEEDEEGGEGDKEHGRRGHGIRRDKAGDGQG
ncbi:unnamed protein product [Closterium sp. NIES-64]|nr:unnamed protein product [Closterium sp. NIES-64]